ncbi:uncharacterized protein LOC110170764 isoform X1 [Boleophthalmus pectinirostris]|uniref:uncharacterized protein LOC110170764 isoform X1 n=1 Tax=Boleophthalmus pectinirostris TaxID=150288 RepID=UPI00242CFCE3|nr:uncharacterized protein LOC110170764 isoform X1 [Boleophthalmus pectinirostris]
MVKCSRGIVLLGNLAELLEYKDEAGDVRDITSNKWRRRQPYHTEVYLQDTQQCKMKIHFVFLLMCAAICASQPLKPRCRCAKTDKSVKLNLISSYLKTDPTIFCNKIEVIVTLKDKREVCIDPNGKFFHFLEDLRKKLAQTRDKKNSITTTAEPTASVKTLQTSSPLMSTNTTSKQK